MIFTLVVVFISLMIFLDYFNKKSRNDMAANIRGPPKIPIFGTHYIFTIRNIQDAIKLIVDESKKYDGISRLWLFHKFNIMISNPELLELIMGSTRHTKKNVLYDILNIWLGQGLLVSSGQKWHSRRKIISPAFHFKILEEFVEIFDQQSAILVEQIRKYEGRKTAFNIYPYVTLAALDVISETSMGVKINAQTDPGCAYVRAVTDITEVLMRRFINVFIQNDLIFKVVMPKEKKRQDDALAVLHDFTERIIQERRTSLEEKSSKKTSIEEDDVGTKKKMALLDVLLQSSMNGKPLTNADIREEVDTFMFEGHDTTTSAICFSLYCISRHPDVQAKIFNEIRQVIGDDKAKPIAYRDLQELKYTEYAIKESMRLYPTVPIIGRQFTEDADINGYRIPAGADLTIPIFVMLKNPKYFPNPEKFDPERHNLENTTETTNPYAYIPFSAGPRNCVGQKFAMLEMKSAISKILRHYELLPLGDAPEIVINFVLRSANGINIGIKARNYY